MKVCPSCQYQNREGVLFCDDCGEPLRDVPSIQTHRLDVKSATIQSKPAIKTSNWGTARFGPKASIVFSVKDVPEQVVVTPNEQVVVGRMDMTTKTSPNVDLSSFGAQEKGVSRMH